jgi:Ca2+-binding RTX toxin-like protein
MESPTTHLAALALAAPTVSLTARGSEEADTHAASAPRRRRRRRRPMNRATLIGGVAAALIAAGADQAAASYAARVEGETLRVTGNGEADKLLIGLQPGAPDILQLDVAGDGTPDFSFNRTTFSAIDVNAGGGDDDVAVLSLGGAFTDEALTIDGAGGDDTLTGSYGAETLVGGSGNDIVVGGLGSDVVRLGTGADTFRWSPGDTSDVVDGQNGDDVVVFNGGNIGESFALAADGSRVRATRNIANVVLDLDGIERLSLVPRGGGDTIAVGPLLGTALEMVDVDQRGSGGIDDGQPDRVVARATDESDSVTVGGIDDGAVVNGAFGRVQVTGAEPGLDSLDVETLDGADTVTAAAQLGGRAEVNIIGGAGPDTTYFRGTAGDDVMSAVANGDEVRMVTPGSAPLDTIEVEDVRLEGLGGADAINGVGQLPAPVTFAGGGGADTLSGGSGGEALLGGSGADAVDGGPGADAVLLGGGADTFTWDPGDGSDSVEGESGSDTVRFNGSNAGEILTVSKSGERVQVHRNVANVTLDFDDVEAFAYLARGGSDTVDVHDLRGTLLNAVDVDLHATPGGGDGAPDTVVATGTDADDVVTVRRSDDQPVVAGLGAETRIAGAEVALDVLRIRTLGGNDQVTVGDVWDVIAPVVDLGPGE